MSENKKQCALGFDCAGMMQAPGIAPIDCANYISCRVALGLEPETEFELLRYRHQQQEQYLETIRLTRSQAATMMLMRRGCPSSPACLGVEEAIDNLLGEIEQLRSQLSPLENEYIAPPGTEVQSYIVTRPWGKYSYNKLTASKPIFTPSIEPRNVKVIHLSRDDDARNIEGRLGIERRNRLSKVLTRLNQAKALVCEAREILERDLIRDVFLD